MKLKDRVAIATGAAQGIGRAIALNLAADGAVIVAADINREGSDETVRLAETRGGQGMSLQMDVTSWSQVNEGVSKAHDALGKIDILVNVAGIDSKAPVWNLEEEEWDRVIAVNLKGVFLVCKAVLPYMIERRYGRIVNIASMAGKTGEAFSSHYCASKSGLIGFTQSMAFETGEYGITANCVCPGPTNTPLMERAVVEEAKSWDMDADEFRDWMYISRTPLGRFATPEDVARAVSFLASDDAEFITGIALNVSGGREVH